jgi:hypothetical protein
LKQNNFVFFDFTYILRADAVIGLMLDEGTKVGAARHVQRKKWWSPCRRSSGGRPPPLEPPAMKPAEGRRLRKGKKTIKVTKVSKRQCRRSRQQ